MRLDSCLLRAGAAGLAVLVACGAHAQSLVADGGFETLGQAIDVDAYTAPYGALAANVAAPWTLGDSGGKAFAGIAADGGLFGAKYVRRAAHAGFVQGKGTIAQKLHLDAGTYDLSFFAMARAGGGSGAGPVRASLGTIFSATATPANTQQAGPRDWSAHAYTLTVPTAGTYALKFAGTKGYAPGADFTTYLDEVALERVFAVNGDFELGTVPLAADAYTTPYGTLAPAAAAPWTLSSSGGQAYAGIAVPGGGLGAWPANGARAAFVQGTGAVSQGVTLAAGAYELVFQAMGRTNGGNGADPLAVSLGGLLSATVTPANATAQSPDDWTLYRLPFAVAAAGTYVLQFAGTRPFQSGSDYATFVDDVHIVPELAVNGSFETTGSAVASDAYTTSFGPLPTDIASGWTFGRSGGASYDGLAAASGGLGGKTIRSGSLAAFVQGTGSIAQTVQLAPGTYTLSFEAMGRVAGGDGADPIAVSIGTLLSATVTPANTAQTGDGAWTRYAYVFDVPAAGAYPLQLRGTRAFGTDGDHTSFIDRVSLARDVNYDLVFIGDSITAGATLADPATQASAMQAARSLAGRFGVGVQVSNQGHSGSTTVDWAPSSSPSSFFGAAVAAAGSLQASRPGQLIFSIMLGTNDSAESGTNGAPVSPPDYLAHMRAIVDHLLAAYPDALVFVNKPTWYSPNTQNGALYGASGLARLQTYFPQIDQLVADCAVAHPHHVFAGDDAQAFSDFSVNYLADLTPEAGVQGTFYLHPNPTGAADLGRYWADVIAATLGMHPLPLSTP